MSSQLRDSPVSDPRRWRALGLLSVAQFLVILDTSIIGVALPAIKDALGFSTVGLQWVFNAYVIAFGGLLLVGGRLADLLGPRRVFAAGFAVLAGSSLVAGLAWTNGVLIAGRALMGLGAALIAPAAHPILVGKAAGCRGQLSAGRRRGAARDSVIPGRPALTCPWTTSRPPSSLPRAVQPACWSSATGRLRPEASPAPVPTPVAGSSRRINPVAVVASTGGASSGPEVAPGDYLRPWPQPATRQSVG